MPKVTVPPLSTARIHVRRRDMGSGLKYRRRGPVVGSNLRKGKLRAALSYRSSAGADVDLYKGAPGSETVSGTRVRAYDWHLLPGESLAAGVTVTVAFIGGYWYVVAAACDPDPNITAPGGGGGGGAGGGSSGSTATLVAQPANSNPALWPPTTMAFPWGN